MQKVDRARTVRIERSPAVVDERNQSPSTDIPARQDGGIDPISQSTKELKRFSVDAEVRGPELHWGPPEAFAEEGRGALDLGLLSSAGHPAQVARRVRIRMTSEGNEVLSFLEKVSRKVFDNLPRPHDIEGDVVGREQVGKHREAFGKAPDSELPVGAIVALRVD